MQLAFASTFQTDMKNDEITAGQFVAKFDSRVPGESALAYQILRGCTVTPGENRNLRSLCDHTVDGKKRSVSQFGRWSSQFSWQERVEAFDAKNADWSSKGSPLSGRRNIDIHLRRFSYRASGSEPMQETPQRVN